MNGDILKNTTDCILIVVDTKVLKPDGRIGWIILSTSVELDTFEFGIAVSPEGNRHQVLGNLQVPVDKDSASPVIYICCWLDLNVSGEQADCSSSVQNTITVTNCHIRGSVMFKLQSRSEWYSWARNTCNGYFFELFSTWIGGCNNNLVSHLPSRGRDYLNGCGSFWSNLSESSPHCFGLNTIELKTTSYS